MIVVPTDPSRDQRERLRVAANHKQALETSLSTCTEPWLQARIAGIKIPLVGRLPHTTTNRRPVGCAEHFPALPGQSAARLITAKERPLMRRVGGV